MNKIIELGCAILSAVWVYMGISQYGFWAEGVPGGGFVPSLFGGITLILCLTLLLKGKGNAVVTNKAVFFPIMMVVAVVIATLLTGMMTALIIMVFSWLKFYEKHTLKRAGIISIVIAGFVFGIFGLWLQVPFPTGIFGI